MSVADRYFYVKDIGCRSHHFKDGVCQLCKIPIQTANRGLRRYDGRTGNRVHISRVNCMRHFNHEGIEL